VGVNAFTSVAVSPERVRQAVGVVAITADVHERTSKVPSFFEGLGAHVEIRALTRGDYVVVRRSSARSSTRGVGDHGT
jgi:ERCC4-type nuclease